MPSYYIRFLMVLFVLSISALAIASCGGSDSLEVVNPWGRPAAEGMNSAVYFRIDNPTDNQETLHTVRTGASDAAEIHLSVMDEAQGGAMNDGTDDSDMDQDDSMGLEMRGDVMRMVQHDSVDIPANGQVSFEPGGLHIMLIGVKQELREGDMINLVLQFDNAGEVTIEVPIEPR